MASSKFRFAPAPGEPIASTSTTLTVPNVVVPRANDARIATVAAQTRRAATDTKGKGRAMPLTSSEHAVASEVVQIVKSEWDHRGAHISSTSSSRRDAQAYFPFGTTSTSMLNVPAVAPVVPDNLAHVTAASGPTTARTVHAALPASILARRKSPSTSATSSAHFVSRSNVPRPTESSAATIVPTKRPASASGAPPNDERDHVDEIKSEDGNALGVDENVDPFSAPSPKRSRPSLDSGYGAGDRSREQPGLELVGPTPNGEERVSDSEGEELEVLTSEADPTAQSSVSRRARRERMVEEAKQAERAKLAAGPSLGAVQETIAPSLEIVERDLQRLTGRRIALLEECLELLNSGATFTESGSDEPMLRNNLNYVAEKTQEQRATLLHRGGKLSDLQIMLEKRASLLDELIEIQTNGTGVSASGSDKGFVEHQLVYINSRIDDLRARSGAITGLSTPRAVASPPAARSTHQSGASSTSARSSANTVNASVVPRLSILSLPQLSAAENVPPPPAAAAHLATGALGPSVPRSSGSSSSLNSATTAAFAQRGSTANVSSRPTPAPAPAPAPGVTAMAPIAKSAAASITSGSSKFRPAGEKNALSAQVPAKHPIAPTPTPVASTSRAAHLPRLAPVAGPSTSKPIILDDDFTGIDFDEPLTIDDDDDMLVVEAAPRPRHHANPAHLPGANLQLPVAQSRAPPPVPGGAGASNTNGDGIDPARALAAPRSNYPWSRDVAKALRQRFGLTGFRANQEDAINATLSGKDVFVLLPTGGGKSLCFQLPAVISTGTTKGLTIVVSPLLSLISDQTKALIDKDIPVVFLNSTMPAADRKFAMDAIRSDPPLACLAYVTPEQIVKSDVFRNVLRDLFRRNQLARFVIDEAHCVSSWGHDFRPDYKEMGTLKKDFPRIPMIALTATANDRVKNDVIANLHMRSPVVLTQSFNRKNLRYEVRPKSKGVINDIATVIRSSFAGKCGIIYCMSKKQCEDTAMTLRERYQIGAQHYHAGMNKDDRLRIQEGWQRNEFHCICATIAFGMGIDKPDVRYVIHYSLSQSLEAYYQETGRAGRDGATSTCILFFAYADTKLINRLIDEGEGTREQKENNRANVRRVVQYCMNETDCRRVQVLRYFGDNDFTADMCHKTCDNCLAARNVQKRDVTQFAQDAIRLVQSIERDKGVTMLYAIDVFRGSKTAKITSKGHDQLPYAGKGSKMERGDVERLFQLLASEAALGERFERNALGFTNAYVTVGPKAREILNGSQKLEMGLAASGNKRAATGLFANDKAPAAVPRQDRYDDGFEDDEDYIEIDDEVASHPGAHGGTATRDEIENLTSPAATARPRKSNATYLSDVDSVLAQLINCRAESALAEDCEEGQLMSDAALQRVAVTLPLTRQELAKIPGCDSEESYEWFLESGCRKICSVARTGRSSQGAGGGGNGGVGPSRPTMMSSTSCGTTSAAPASKAASSAKACSTRATASTASTTTTSTAKTSKAKQLNIERFALSANKTAASGRGSNVGGSGARGGIRGRGVGRGSGGAAIRAMPVHRK